MLSFRRLGHVLLGDRVLRPECSDRGRRLAGLLENLGQLFHEPFLGDVGLADGRQHRPHRALCDAELATGLGNLLIRAFRGGFDQCAHLLGGEADCHTGKVEVAFDPDVL